jgi:hypothetical protein
VTPASCMRCRAPKFTAPKGFGTNFRKRTDQNACRGASAG